MSTDAKKGSEPTTVGRVSRRVECLDPAQDDLMPDIYTDEDAANDIALEPVDDSPLNESPLDFDKSKGFNPYDTGSLFKK